MHRPQWARASSFTWFLDHTQRLTTVDRTPIDCYSAVISGPRDHRPRHLTCDNSLLCPRTHTHTQTHTRTHTYTNSHIYLHIFCHLYCRHFVGSSYIRGLGSAGHPTSTGTLPSSFVFLGIILLGLRSGHVTHPLLLSSSGILLKCNPLSKSTATQIGYRWISGGILFNCIPW